MRRLIVLIGVAMATSGAFAADPGATLIRNGKMSSALAMSGPLPLDPDDPAWSKATPTALLAYPQRMIAPGLEDGAPVPIELRALVDRKRLAVRLTWSDPSPEPYRDDQTDTFPDAAAVQFAQLGPNGSLPYIGMGEKHRPVSIWFWRAGGGPEILVARGFGTASPGRGAVPIAKSLWRGGKWSIVLVGPLTTGSNPLPLALAVWDGHGHGRGGRKQVTTWHLLRLPGRAEAPSALAGLTKEAIIRGNVERGRTLAEEHGCGGCHRLRGAEAVEIGPDLAFAGGIHWPGYLRRSIVSPSEFIVPLARYREHVEQGQERSLMPAAPLRGRDLDDLVAYLASLK